MAISHLRMRVIVLFLIHVDFFRAAGSTGSFRKRLPVATKIALVTAGTIAAEFSLRVT